MHIKEAKEEGMFAVCLGFGRGFTAGLPGCCILTAGIECCCQRWLHSSVLWKELSGGEVGERR